MSSLLVFPGQGAQQAGMLQRLPRETLVEASDVLGKGSLILGPEQIQTVVRNSKEYGVMQECIGRYRMVG